MELIHCPLAKTVTEFAPTDVWNDSCSLEELEYSIARGAVGATTNPVIVGDVLKKEMHLWKDHIVKLVHEMPEATEDDITWKIIEEMAQKGASLLQPVFEQSKGKKGRLSIQTNAKYYRNAQLMTEQAKYFHTLAPNMQVKMPVTAAGIKAVEEATYAGVSVNATVSFTVPQALAVAEAVERGLNRREMEGLPVGEMSPVCTLMVGRLDDWLKVVAKNRGILIDPWLLDWAGVAAFKKAYTIYKECRYRTRLLSAAYRTHLHWSEFIGGDIIMTIPCSFQKKINACDVPVISRMDNPVDPEIVKVLLDKFPDFRRAYEPDGMAPSEFEGYGATARTLRSFIAAYDSLAAVIRDFMLPDPDRIK